MPDNDSRAAYLSARKLGRKYLSEHERDEDKGLLPVLEDRLKDVKIMGEINLGYHEIPLDRIVGTRTAARSNSFAGNFMPLLADDTEFAVKWQKVYASQLVEGIKEPISVYEYINRYYVLEGNKRVSILKYVGAASIYGSIIRLLPERDNKNDEISIYYEFLDYDKKLFVENLWFNRRGNFTRLIKQTEDFRKEHPEIKQDTGELINYVHRRFHEAFRESKIEDVGLTSGDALVEYTKIFGYPYDASMREMTRNIKRAKSQFLVAVGRRHRNTIEISALDTMAPVRQLRARPTVLRLAFAFHGSAEDNLFTGFHAIAIDRIEKKYGSRLKISRKYNCEKHPGGFYAAVSELIQDKPNILFATSPTLSDASLRVALENPDMIVLNCDTPKEGKNLNTYFSRMFDLTFLCGILAGAMSRSGIIGYMNTTGFGFKTTYEINAFALGARLINPRASALDYTLKSINSWEEHTKARHEFALNGADVVFCRHSPDNPLERKAFPEVYAQLYTMSNKGYLLESLAAATFDWEPFYDKVISDALMGRTALLESRHIGGNPIHLGWGLSTGIMDIYPVNAAIGERTAKLVNIFRELIWSDKISPFEGPVWDNEGNLRIESGKIPQLIEIQRINWLESSVRELNA
ncbi:MAG: BMP family ABC transporter substrate-binding protein [Papillibacter sp.]|nr:BMP family ABC transporter substrate-binding protein [Papillibacter sp.]